jgi:hypothetical protein
MHTFTYIFDGTTMSGYVDGVLFVTGAAGGLQNTLEAPIMIGASLQNSNPTSFFSGTMYSVKIWNSESMVDSNLVGSFGFNNSNTTFENMVPNTTDTFTLSTTYV